MVFPAKKLLCAETGIVVNQSKAIRLAASAMPPLSNGINNSSHGAFLSGCPFLAVTQPDHPKVPADAYAYLRLHRMSEILCRPFLIVNPAVSSRALAC